VKEENRMFEIKCFGVIGPVRRQRFVSECNTKEDREQSARGGLAADSRRSI
jgi:hypothetical protein